MAPTPNAVKWFIKGSMGSGKTGAVLEEIAKLRGSIIFAVPTLVLAEEIYTRYEKILSSVSPIPLIVRGRSAPDPDSKNSTMCLRADIAHETAQAGLPVEKTICKSCHKFNDCGYQKQKKNICSTSNLPCLYIVTHQYLFLESFLPDVRGYVIDEAINAIEMTDFTPDRISRCIGSMPENAGPRPKRALETLKIIEGVFTNGCSGSCLHDVRTSLTLKQILQTSDYLEGRLVAEIPDIGGQSDEQIKTVINQHSRKEIKQVFCFLRQIEREWSQPREIFNSIFITENMPSKAPDGKRERQRRICVSTIRPLTLPVNSSILILDGTGDEVLYRKLFGNELKAHEFNIAIKAWVTQINSRGFSRQSIMGGDMYGKPLSEERTRQAAQLSEDLVAAISHHQDNVLAVGSKKVMEHLDANLPASVHREHFAALRGVNKYDSTEKMVLIGREQPSALEVERIARAYAADELYPFLTMVDAEHLYGQYVKQTRMRRLADGTLEPQEVWAHAEPLAQAVLEQIREAESMQAIARVRPITNECDIIIASDLVLDITVNRSIGWPDFCAGGTRIERVAAISPVVPMSPLEMHRLFPKMWGSQKAAERDLTKTPRLQIDIYLQRGGFQKCRYKLSLTTAKPYEAFVRGNKTALESITGAVAWFECNTQIESPEASKAPTSEPVSIPVILKSVRNRFNWQEKFDERAAIIEHDAGIPRAWAEAFAHVCLMQRPANITRQGWQRIVDNSGKLLDNKNHLRDMMRYGWTVDDIFGVDESATEKWQAAKVLLLMLDDNEVASIINGHLIGLRHSYSGTLLHYTKPVGISAN